MILGLGGKGQTGVGCYGKLQTHGDYVSHQSDGGEARRLTAWLDEGYRLTGGKDDLDDPATSFVLPGKKKASLYGRLWPSADSSGTRRFPFALFAEAQIRALADLGALVPFGLQSGLSAMDGAWSGLNASSGAEEIGHLVSEIPVPPVPPLRDTRYALHARIGNDALTPLLVGALLDLARLTNALPAGSKGKAPPFAIRLPLATHAAPEEEASVWLSVLSTRLRSPKLAADTAIFMRPGKGESPGDLCLFHRELKPDDLGFVLTPTDEYQYANMLGTEMDEEAIPSFRAWLAERVGSAPTLAEVAGLDLSEFSA
jgi:type VI secretion system ImpM family protein